MKFDRFFHLTDTPGIGVTCSKEGLFVGETPLLERAHTVGHRTEWRLRALYDLNRDLGRTYDLPVDFAGKISGIATIARALGRGDLIQAQIATLLLQIPDPPELTKAGTSFSEWVRLALQMRHSGLLKANWDPLKHPRWPAKSPDGVGGQFAPSGASADTADSGPSVIQVQATIVAPPIELPAPVPLPLPSEIVPPLVAPNIAPRSLPQNPYPGRPECVKEWQEAFQFCWGLKTKRQLGAGDYRGMGRTMRDCMMGQVSESCGGDATGA